MSDTLISEGQQTNAADQQQAASAPPVSQTQPTGEQAATQQQVSEGQTAEGQQAESGKTEGEQAKLEGAPEAYEFNAPEGTRFDESVIGQFSEVAKELNLSQDAAQKLLDKMTPALEARQAEAVQAIRTEWETTSKADKEFGGDKLNENLGVAKQALEKFGSPELRTLLNESGLGNHPEVIRLLYRAGKAISEDGFVSSTGASSRAQKDAASALYPNQR
jgi:hypothetical protein